LYGSLSLMLLYSVTTSYLVTNIADHICLSTTHFNKKQRELLL